MRIRTRTGVLARARDGWVIPEAVDDAPAQPLPAARTPAADLTVA